MGPKDTFAFQDSGSIYEKLEIEFLERAVHGEDTKKNYEQGKTSTRWRPSCDANVGVPRRGLLYAEPTLMAGAFNVFAPTPRRSNPIALPIMLRSDGPPCETGI